MKTTTKMVPRIPHVPSSSTSKAAAESMQKSVVKLRELVLSAVGLAGAAGITCDGVEMVTGLTHQTISPRVNELAKAKKIVDSGRKGLTRSNRKAVKWVLPEFVG
jgi:hypothetical protein